MSSAILETPAAPSLVVDTGGFAGTRRSDFPAVRPTGYFSPDADPAAVQRFFAANGYLVLEDAFSAAEIETLKRETTLICRGERGELPDHPRADPAELDDSVLRRFLCIHFPHKCSAVMTAAIHNAPSVAALTHVIGPNVKFMQSMLFIKASGKPGQAWHQDEDYIPTRDRSLTGAWIALDRATIDNGCLWVLPGSHRPGILWEQQWHGDRRFDCSDQSVGFPYRDEQAVPVEVAAGSVVFFNGYLLHRSLPNRAPEGTYRRALVNHYMSCESFLPWGKTPDDQHNARYDYRDIIIVAGQDPYAYRGYADIQKPTVRPSGEGGCDKWGGTTRTYPAATERTAPVHAPAPTHLAHDD
ncbi:phytanoyl-CoA dioxygenase family protein [Horticoccus luteus]|uniref:Phytanoyl-CoA dioxygenase family protein n=1 Tax=Horticoccus luteus TaxID=2862869 RepID=A0A8F9TX83_9BACT|nr:phytanoyl-CoA dioxygenase family protein [Horticoccus luteus]QYM79519.1 phytanoyl-CoA dioxygenase family protein [Horticoccus luteus]